MAQEKKEWYRMTEAERRFADLIWENEPVGSGELVKLCEERFGWKKSTTYTFLKKLCGQGIFENQDSRVSAKIDRESYDQGMGEQFVQETYGGSLPKMIAAFISRKKLSRQQVDEIRKMIDDYGE
ncbi:MAG: BlaI/MecI/CopY family transcriptional regulator [Lachnospiraceae bacterium]|nr:BlaI/MecI/CopY family transcriptional regulator [Lachnospiraceae bacterium]